MSLALLGYGLAPTVMLLAPLAILGGTGNGMANVCVATLVLTRTGDQMRGRVSAALGGVVNAASIASLVIGGGLAALLTPRQIFLLAGGLGGMVTIGMVARTVATARGRTGPAATVQRETASAR